MDEVPCFEIFEYRFDHHCQSHVDLNSFNDKLCLFNISNKNEESVRRILRKQLRWSYMDQTSDYAGLMSRAK